MADEKPETLKPDTEIVFISACKHDSNKIPTAIPMFMRSCIVTALVIYQGKWYIKDGGL